MLIGCYYYAWYGKEWLHKTARKNDPPLLGEYNNIDDLDICVSHFESMKDHGIDFVSVSWDNKKDYARILAAAKQTGMKVTYFYESLCNVGKNGIIPASAIGQLEIDIDRISKDMQDESWLRINNRPVLMIYVTRTFKDNPAKLFKMIRDKIQNVFMVGDELFWGGVEDQKIKMFDAVTMYNMYEMGKFRSSTETETAESYLHTAKRQGLIFKAQCERLNVPLWGCALPGYNDTGVRPDVKHKEVSRLGGNFFKHSLNDAIETSALDQAIMITSFNEWYEDTQIEPAASYGTKYLRIVKDIKKTFRPKLSFVVTCKGRLPYVQKTIQTLITQPDSEYIFVDYSCPQNSGDWVSKHFPQAKVIKVPGHELFSLPKAKNIGIPATRGEWVCITDADIVFSYTFSELLPTLSKSCYYIADGRKTGTYGTILVHRGALARVKYDENVIGWGKDDDIFFELLQAAGFKERTFNESYVKHLEHTNEERMAFYPIKDQLLNLKINEIYQSRRRGATDCKALYESIYKSLFKGN